MYKKIYFTFFLDRDILDNIKINRYNSQFKIINGYDGSIMINTTNSILDFGYYNKTRYMNGMFAYYMLIYARQIISIMSYYEIQIKNNFFSY